MNSYINWCLFLSIGLLFSQSVFAKEYRVSSAKEFNEIEEPLSAGDVVTLVNGIWENQIIEFTANGSLDNPVILKAETPGEVQLTGNSRLSVKGSSVIISGLLFIDGALDDEKEHIIRLEGSHHRLTQSAIINYNPESIDTRYFWVSLYGDHHRIDHNIFSGQNHSGVTNAVWLKGDNVGHHQIDHNYYGQRPIGNGNGFETIRIGTGRFSHIDAHVLVENNVFEETDGEIEIISNKSNHNTYRHNTFINSSGTLTLRQGQYNIVEGNYFLGKFRKGSGGVRIISQNQLIINNHFENLNGRADGIISVTAGNGLLSDEDLPLYPRVENSLIIGNTCINNNAPCIALNADFGQREKTLLAENLLITHNSFYHDEPDTNFVVGKMNDSIIWSNNQSSGSTIGYETDGVSETKLSLEILFGQVSKLPSVKPLFKCDMLDTLLPKKSWDNIDKLKQRCNQTIRRKKASAPPMLRDDVGPEWLKNI